MHARRPGLDAEERRMALALSARFWDGTEITKRLPGNPELRPWAIARTIEMEVVHHGLPLSKVIDDLKKHYMQKPDPVQKALDSITVCLTVISFLPEH